MKNIIFYIFILGRIEIDGRQAKAYTKMLIDDIRVQHRSCQPTGSCDFESGDNCGWENLQTTSGEKKVLWLRIQPNSRYIKGLFMYYDHTTSSKKGSYLVIPALMQAGGYSTLRSPIMRTKHYAPVSTAVCFSMWYFAKGVNESVNALTVRLVDLGKNKNYVWTFNASTELHWMKAEFEVDKVPNTYVFHIEGLFD